MDELLKKIKDYKKEIKEFSSSDAKLIEEFRIKWLGTKGIVKNLMGEMKSVPNEKKKEFGQVMNEFKIEVESKFEELKTSASASRSTPQASSVDLTLPGDPLPLGSRHPVSL